MGQSERRAAAVRDLDRAGVRDMHVQIVGYDRAWPAAFQAERQRLAPLLDGVEIHHIGSTAVPGLAAKPIIDMIVCVECYEGPIRRLVSEAAYQYPQAFNATLTKRRFLLYPTPETRTHHLHLIDDYAQLKRYLTFRENLRADPDLAAEYAALKRTLAARFPLDREAYTDAKTQFIRSFELALEKPHRRRGR
jgi:GrpB-like predicted nucleotidyltransferase (UPF0157 family)